MNKTLIIFVISLVVFGCTSEKSKYRRDSFSNLLNIKNTPESAKDWDAFCFSDQGSWHGYALSSEDSNIVNGFAGPFLMTHGRWLAKSLSSIEITNKATGNIITPENVQGSYLPGKLKQLISYSENAIEQELIFITEQTSLIRYDFANFNIEEKEIYLSGELLLDNVKLNVTETGLSFDIPGDSLQYVLYMPAEQVDNVTVDEKSYRIKLNTEAIKANTLSIIQGYITNPKSKEALNHDIYLSKTRKYFQKNENRWNKYIQSVLLSETDFQKDVANQRATVKCLQTLVSNWKAPYKEIKKQGLFPSIGVWYFNGFWAWDSWKHSAAVVNFNFELAENQIQAMFDYQDEEGMVADCIFANSADNNWRDTKPPLAAWAVWEVYKKGDNRFFLSEMYPKLKKYHYWWYSHRDHDKDGLCEYGSTDGTRIAAAWESGMDNAVRFDDAIMLKNSENAWSLNQESVDLNAYLYAEKLYLSKIAEELSFFMDSKIYQEEAEKLKVVINEKMFDAESGYYYDIAYDTEKFVKVQGPEGWIPLWAGVAEQSHADAVVKVMMDTAKFNTHVPLLTLQADHPKLDPYDGYWRGPVWLDQVYFGIKGMRAYGYNDEARLLTEKVFNNLEGFKNNDMPIRENYHPKTGEGLNAEHFSWSAGHLLMLYMEY